jgi:hypothetical protein
MKMGIGLAMATLGAILRYAIDSRNSETVDVPIVGLILMIVGAIAFITSAVLEFTKRRTESPPPPALPAESPTPMPPTPPAPPPKQ